MAQMYPPTPSNMPIRIAKTVGPTRAVMRPTTAVMKPPTAKQVAKANARGLKAANKPGPLKVRTTGGLGGGTAARLGAGGGMNWQTK